jgi:adenosylcobinamide-phosphate synthase
MMIGDPPNRFHPVRLMGRLAGSLERPCRRITANERAAGVVAAGLVVGTATLTTAAMTRIARRAHPWIGHLVSVILLYFTFATRDLALHARTVQNALERQDLAEARRATALMVGRDTQELDSAGVVRATIESVAENTVDGVTSPLFYAFLGGAPAAMAFKAISTLDSTFGYKNERYLNFGWASARLDDAANYLPARLTVPFIAAAAGLLGSPPSEVIRTARKDGRKHASPNSALAEAAFAGALGIRLGGPLYSGGRLIAAPHIGSPKNPLDPRSIQGAVGVMNLTFLLALTSLACFAGLRALNRVAEENPGRPVA